MKINHEMKSRNPTENLFSMTKAVTQQVQSKIFEEFVPEKTPSNSSEKPEKNVLKNKIKILRTMRSKPVYSKKHGNEELSLEKKSRTRSSVTVDPKSLMTQSQLDSDVFQKLNTAR